MYYLAENLAQRQIEWSQRLQEICGVKKTSATAEVEATVNRLFSYAAWADKYDGAVHNAPYRGITLAMHEPVGVIGLVCPERLPLLAMVALLAPTVAMGNRVVLIPSERYALLALDLVQVLETSDIPAGVINLVAGDKLTLAQQLAGHAEVDSLWCWCANPNGVIERAAAANLKRCWMHHENDRDWFDPRQGEGLEFLRQATEVKNIWTPYGD
jgi:aldehyde dehydrogenase (NAD+)